MFTRRKLGAALLAASPVASAQSGFQPAPQIVYSNITNKDGFFTDILPGGGIGDIVTLAGTARRITRAEMFILPATTNTSFPMNLKFSLYLPAPGTNLIGALLYTSGFQPYTFTPNVESFLAFDVPNVLVPSEVTWTVEFNGFDAFLEVPAFYRASPATVGNDNPRGPGYWFFNPLFNRWVYQAIAGTSYLCRLIAE